MDLISPFLRDASCASNLSRLILLTEPSSQYLCFQSSGVGIENFFRFQNLPRQSIREFEEAETILGILRPEGQPEKITQNQLSA